MCVYVFDTVQTNPWGRPCKCFRASYFDDHEGPGSDGARDSDRASYSLVVVSMSCSHAGLVKSSTNR